MYGGEDMTKDQIQHRFRFPIESLVLQILLAFLTGSFLGCFLLHSVGLFSTSPLVPNASTFAHSILLCFGKTIVLIYLSAFIRLGPLFVPPLIGVEGFFLCCYCAIVFRCFPAVSAVLLVLSMVLIVSFSAVLGTWSLRIALSTEINNRNSFLPVFFFTALIFCVSFVICYFSVSL